MINLRKTVLLILLIPALPAAKAQVVNSELSRTLNFDLPLFDLPYQYDAAKTVGDGNLTFGTFMKGYSNPGMHLSMAVSADLYTVSHWGIEEIFYPGDMTYLKERKRLKRYLYGFTLAGFDILSIYAPLFDGWEHEEYHRAVLSRYHVSSFNDMNRFPVGSDLVNVSHVKDDDLIRLKQESPADLIRAHVAGIEGEYLLTDRLQRNNFYYNQELPHELLYLLTTLNSILYVGTCSDPEEADKLTDEANANEIPVEVRDFTGLDFLAWTYDLFRPDEPYTSRGIHPSGTGIDRYIRTTDLAQEEMSYLKRQGKLQWLNLVSPMMIGIRRIRLNNKGLYGNIALRHYLNSFGNDISVSVFLMNRYNRYNFAFHSYQNYNRSFPALEAQLIDKKIPFFSAGLLVSPRLIAGIQPLNQEFKTSESAFLGMAECRVELRARSYINPFAEISAKTAGWVAGNEFLDSNLSIRIGISSRIQLKR